MKWNWIFLYVFVYIIIDYYEWVCGFKQQKSFSSHAFNRILKTVVLSNYSCASVRNTHIYAGDK